MFLKNILLKRNSV